MAQTFVAVFNHTQSTIGVVRKAVLFDNHPSAECIKPVHADSKLDFAKKTAKNVAHKMVDGLCHLNDVLRGKGHLPVFVSPGTKRIIGNKNWQASFHIEIFESEQSSDAPMKKIYAKNITSKSAVYVRDTEEFGKIVVWEDNWRLSKEDQQLTLEEQLLVNDEDKSYYDILGCKSEDSYEEIRKKYLKKIVQLHPDKLHRSLDRSVHYHAAKVNEAWEVLKDSERRKQYEKLQKEGHQSWLSCFTDPQFWKKIKIDGRFIWVVGASCSVLAGFFLVPAVLLISSVSVPVLIGIGAGAGGALGAGIAINSYVMSEECEKNGTDIGTLASRAAIGFGTGAVFGCSAGIIGVSVGGVFVTLMVEGGVIGGTSAITQEVAKGIGSGEFQQKLENGKADQVVIQLVKQAGIGAVSGVISGGIGGLIHSSAISKSVVDLSSTVISPARQLISSAPFLRSGLVTCTRKTLNLGCDYVASLLLDKATVKEEVYMSNQQDVVKTENKAELLELQ